MNISIKCLKSGYFNSFLLNLNYIKKEQLNPNGNSCSLVRETLLGTLKPIDIKRFCSFEKSNISLSLVYFNNFSFERYKDSLSSSASSNLAKTSA